MRTLGIALLAKHNLELLAKVLCHADATSACHGCPYALAMAAGAEPSKKYTS